MTGEQLIGLIEFFKGKPVNDNVLQEYSNLHKLPEMVDMDKFGDYMYQYEFEQKLITFHTKVVNALARLKPNVDYITNADFEQRRAISLGFECDMIAFAEEAGFSPKETKDAIAKVMATITFPFINAERKIKESELRISEILLEQHGGNTIKNMNELLQANK